MATTYLSLMNNVLRRLREDEVSEVTQTTYSRMVGDYINDAKTLVQDSHDWSTLRKTVIVPTVEDITEYSLTGAGERVKLYSAINDTSNFFMHYETPNWFSNVCSREPNLTDDASSTVLPSMPIIHQAVALLSRERGETGGTTTQDYFIIADKYLSDAIAQDAYKNPEEFIYTVQ